MTFLDQSHINRVRDALWQRSLKPVSNGARLNAPTETPPEEALVNRANTISLYPSAFGLHRCAGDLFPMSEDVHRRPGSTRPYPSTPP